MFTSVICNVATASVLCTAATAHAGDWKPLLNGKDLSGWTAVGGPQASWRFKDGVLSCTGKGSGWLSTDKQYGDFELELEFRVPESGNSGVFLRAPREGKPHVDGMEIQILDDNAKQHANLKPAQYCGSLYGVAAAAPRTSGKPGEWQKLNIVCRGDHVTVKLNGTQVVDARLSEHKDKFETNPGLKRSQGHVGLQNYALPTDFRGLRIRELTP